MLLIVVLASFMLAPRFPPVSGATLSCNVLVTDPGATKGILALAFPILAPRFPPVLAPRCPVAFW